MTRPIPAACIAFVKAREQLRLHAYRPTARDVPTIGWGHTRGVALGQKCTFAEAEAWLAADLKLAADALPHIIGEEHVARLNDNQYAALISFVFNVGADPTWRIWKCIKAGADDEVPTELARFVYQGKVMLPGLAHRRRDEIALWNEPVAATISAPSDEAAQISAPPERPAESARPPATVAPHPALLIAQVVAFMRWLFSGGRAA